MPFSTIILCPRLSVATTGNPEANDSTKFKPNPSRMLVAVQISDAAYKASLSSLQPRNLTCSLTPILLA